MHLGGSGKIRVKKKPGSFGVCGLGVRGRGQTCVSSVSRREFAFTNNFDSITKVFCNETGFVRVFG